MNTSSTRQQVHLSGKATTHWRVVPPADLVSAWGFETQTSAGYNARMNTQRWRISLQWFMLLGAASPPIVGMLAGVFGRLFAIISWILVIAAVGYAATYLILLTAGLLKHRVARLMLRPSQEMLDAPPRSHESWHKI
jgi:hypothetical protein